ncbi:M24 family metallopeptidase [Naumannella halotolerans]|uniref:M24 family metallopeptidase n=1 Tax=Naumannella halotolerans TaxID=993414 RepID=UPI00370DDD9F
MSSVLDPSVFGRRLERAASLAAGAGLAGLLVTPGADLRYLVGSEAESFERLTCLVIPADGRPASLVVPHLELGAWRTSAVTTLGLPVLDWIDGADPYALVLDALGTPATAAVTDAMPALHLIPLNTRLAAPAVSATPLLSQLWMRKDESEIAQLREAGAAIDRVHAGMARWLRAGRTEREVGADIASAIVAEGHARADFVIVGSGPNGADPHHEVSDRVINNGDIVVVDIGGPLPSGYNSDCTRTYSIGAPDPAIAAQIAALEEAQASAVAAVRPGISAEAIDARARESLRRAGLGEFFTHRTGHGIGLSVHEAPYIVAGNTLAVEPGMAFSVEPGIYHAGEWGARIEDIVVVTADGCERLNNQPRGLTVLPAT